MTGMQWLYAVGIALFLTALLELGSIWLAKLTRRHSPKTRIEQIARSIVYFIFCLYSGVRIANPALDRHISPAAFVFSWVIVGGGALHLISQAQGSKEKSTSSTAHPPRGD